MAQTETQVVATELERVHKQVPTLFDRDGPFYAALKRKPIEVVSNRDMRLPLAIRTGGNFGHFDPAGGDMERADAPQYDKAIVQPAFLKYGIEWQTKAQWATDDRRKAVLNNVRELLAKSMVEFRRHADSLCMTAGDGVLGTITSVANAGGKDTYTCTTDGYGVKLMRFNQTINVYDAALAVRRTTGEGTKIDLYELQDKRVRVPQVAASVATDKIVAGGLSATPPVSIKGVPYHHSNASTGTWLGMDRAANPEIRSNRVNGNSAALTLPLPRLAINKIGDAIGDDNISSQLQAWMHPAQSQAYEQLGFLVTQLNQTGEKKGLDLYFGGLQRMAGASVKKSFKWDKTRIDFIDLAAWGRAVMHEAGFYEVGNRRIFEIRGASGGLAASQIFYIAAAFDVFTNNPPAGSYIDALKVPAGY